MVVEVINNISPHPYHLVGLIDDDPGKKGKEIAGNRVLGGSEHLLPLVDLF